MMHKMPLNRGVRPNDEIRMANGEWRMQESIHSSFGIRISPFPPHRCSMGTNFRSVGPV